MQASTKGTQALINHSDDLIRDTGVQDRFAKSMREYCEAITRQVHLQTTSGELTTIGDLLKLRRDSIATTPIYALIE